MIINGKERHFQEVLTVEKLLEKLNLSKDVVVIEINREIIAKEQYSSRVLQDDDRVEIITFVGGG